MNSTANAEIHDVARGTLLSLSEDRLVLGVPGTEYRLQFVPGVPDLPGARITTPIGKRIKGTIEGRALRMFKAEVGGGGRFIEPIVGEPRIVAGLVEAIDAPNRRVLVNVAVPMWLRLEEGQNATAFAVGDLVNCYMQSGARFMPR